MSRGREIMVHHAELMATRYYYICLLHGIGLIMKPLNGIWLLSLSLDRQLGLVAVFHKVAR